MGLIIAKFSLGITALAKYINGDMKKKMEYNAAHNIIVFHDEYFALLSEIKKKDVTINMPKLFQPF